MMMFMFQCNVWVLECWSVLNPEITWFTVRSPLIIKDISSFTLTILYHTCFLTDYGTPSIRGFPDIKCKMAGKKLALVYNQSHAPFRFNFIWPVTSQMNFWIFFGIVLSFFDSLNHFFPNPFANLYIITVYL